MGTEATGLDYDLVRTQEKQEPFSWHPQKQTALELQTSKPTEKKDCLQDTPQASF